MNSLLCLFLPLYLEQQLGCLNLLLFTSDIDEIFLIYEEQNGEIPPFTAL
ncbi:hypothetical protein AB4Z45_28890 [Paenibacillus sp. MCAF9]|nr:hypothetical protein [Paenibacillus sp. FSL A5-0031]